MAAPLPPDPYVALGVPKDATSAAVKSAHRKLVLKCHPDKVSDPAAKQAASDLFHKIQSSYEILIDEDRRARYDAQVRLADLRKEALDRRGGSDSVRRSQDPRSASGPQRSSRESSFADAHYPRDAEGVTPQYEERRPAYASADFGDAPARATTRKDPEPERASRRPANDARDRAKAPAARDSSRERQRTSREDRKQRVQRDIRQNRDRKSGPYVDDTTESDSDGYARRSRRTRDDEDVALRRAREELYEHSLRQQKEATTNANYDDRTRKMFAQHSDAWDYIRQSQRPRRPAEQERRPSPVRMSSGKDKTEHVVRGADGRPAGVTRRSSVRPKTEDRDAELPRRRPARESERRSPEAMEDFRRPPAFAKSFSSPVEIRLPPEKPRAQSWQDDADEPLVRNPMLKRAETMPYNGASRRGEGATASKAYARPTEVSDGVPTSGPTHPYDAVSPSAKHSYARPYADDTEYATPDGYRTSADSYRTEVREPKHGRPAYTRQVTRSPSPIDHREMRERPRMPGVRYSSSSQAAPPPPPGRTMSYMVGDSGVELVDRSRPSGSRAAPVVSPREPHAPSPRLYGELNPAASPRPSFSTYPTADPVGYSKHVRSDMRPEDLRPQSGYSSYQRSSGDRPSVHRNGSSKPVVV